MRTSKGELPIPLKWEDPPPARPRATRTADLMEALSAQPGKWARIRECDSRGAAFTGASKLRAQGLEARAAPAPEGSGWAIWARINVPTPEEEKKS